MCVRRFPPGLMMIVPVTACFGLYAFTTQEEAPGSATPTATIEPAATATPTPDALLTAIAAHATQDAERTPADLEPARTPAPAPAQATSHGEFHNGARVRVNAGAGDCLNARNAPGTEDEWVIVIACLPDGFEGEISGEPSERDGRWWWPMAGIGWVAEEYLVYTGEADEASRVIPGLQGAGKIAFVRDGDLWLMEADGSEQRVIKDLPESDHGGDVRNVSWSPDGTRLLFEEHRWDSEFSTSDVRVLTLDTSGAVVGEMVIREFRAGNWSPDSRQIAGVADAELAQMGSGAEGVPAIADAETGEIRRFGVERFGQAEPPRFNRDGALLLVDLNKWDDGEAAEPRVEVWNARDGTLVHRMFLPEDSWPNDMRWSPTDDQIAFYAYDAATQTTYHALYDIATGMISRRTAMPALSEKAGGRCGGEDMYQLEWTADGSTVLFPFTMGDTGDNGVFVWNPATGEQRPVATGSAWKITPGPGEWFAFDGGGIFVARRGDAFPAMLAEGSQPAWWPAAVAQEAPPPSATPQATATPELAGTETATWTLTPTPWETSTPAP